MGLPAVIPSSSTSSSMFHAVPSRTGRTPAAGEDSRTGAAADSGSGAGTDPGRSSSSSSSGSSSGTTLTLSPQAQQQIRTLERTDQQVRTHEQAHQAAGGPHAGGASYTYQKGPDGKNYAVAGEVPIDVSRESTPEATISKMETVKAAALAPADPSPQDRAVAQQADALKLQAQQEKTRESAPSAQGGNSAGANQGAAGTAPLAMAVRGTAAYGAAAALMRATAPSLALSV